MLTLCHLHFLLRGMCVRRAGSSWTNQPLGTECKFELVGRNYPGITLGYCWEKVTVWIPMITSLHLWLQRSGQGYISWAPAQPLCPSPATAAPADRPRPPHCQLLVTAQHIEWVCRGKQLPLVPRGPCWYLMQNGFYFTEPCTKWLCPNRCATSVITRTNIPLRSTYRLGQKSHNWCFGFHCLI